MACLLRYAKYKRCNSMACTWYIAIWVPHISHLVFSRPGNLPYISELAQVSRSDVSSKSDRISSILSENGNGCHATLTRDGIRIPGTAYTSSKSDRMGRILSENGDGDLGRWSREMVRDDAGRKMVRDDAGRACRGFWR